MNEPAKNEIQLFENQRIRVAWDAEREEWYFSIVDVVAVLTDQPDYDHARNYWKVLKAETGKPVVTAQNAEGFRQLVTDIVTDAAQLPEQAATTGESSVTAAK